MEKETQHPKSQTLPDDIIFDQILPRLPVKSLIRFKSVSKSWLSTISTPKFAKSHLKQSTSQSTQFLIFSGNRDPPPLFTSVTFDQHGRVEETLKFNYTFKGSGDIHVVGSCNGLVCFSDSRFNFYIINPATQQSSDVIILSSTVGSYYNLRHIRSTPPEFTPDKVFAAGFGYVSSIDDYKIVCLTEHLIRKYIRLADHKIINLHRFYYFYIFSLRNWKWEKSIKINVNGFGIARHAKPAVVNDFMYWCDDCLKQIYRVNLVNSEITTIENGSYSLNYHFGGRVELHGIKGRLYLECVRKMWSFNEDGCSSWMEMYDLTCDGMLTLCFSETTGKWLVLYGKMMLALLDPSKSFKRQAQDNIKFDGNVFSGWDYNMSLVSPVLE